jgi:uncharacterized protein (TIGR00725 family)
MRQIKYKIAVCGASKVHICCSDIKKLAEEVGREIVKNNCLLINGATSGVADYAAKAAKEMKGLVVGFSPAKNKKDHLKRYNLPIDNYDIIFYTGFGYGLRNFLLTKLADGVIVVCGRFGTLHELTSAIEEKKPVGILEGTLGTADFVKTFIKKFDETPENIVFDKDPKKLVKKLINLIEKVNK